MRSDAAAYSTANFERDVTATLWPKARTFEQVIRGTATGGISLTDSVASITQSHDEATLRLTSIPSDCDDQPKPGQIVSIDADGQRFWNGIIDQVSDFREQRGARSVQLVTRTRDGFGLWRDNRFVTGVYPAGTLIERIARDIARAMGLQPAEYRFPATGFTQPHTNAQMADMSPWDMLETVLLPAGLGPVVDAVGRLKTWRREVTRARDLVLAQERVLAITGARARPSINNVKLKWLDKNLAKVTQQDQVLAQDSVTAGFFKLLQERDEWFSDDHRLRAEHSRMVVKQSCNSGLIPFCTEEYEQIDTFHGKLSVTTSIFVPLLATASLAGLIAAHDIPDEVSFGFTIPVGRIVEGLLQGVIMLVMMSLGTGHYEFWGIPYDYVHARNTTEAYDRTAPAHQDNEQVIENDFISNENHARAVAVRELLHGIASSSTWGCSIVDDPRIERGDIIELPDQSRLFVTGYSRDLSRGSAAVLDVQGFRC